MKRALLVTLFLVVAATANAQIPNGNFETTIPVPIAYANGWYTRNVYQPDSIVTCTKASGNGGSVVHLETVLYGTYLYMGIITNSQNGLFPGNPPAEVPYIGSNKPIQLGGMLRYNVITNDTAIITAIFKKNGVVISTNNFKIYGSMSSFVPFTFNIGSMSAVPDSFIINAYSSNPFQSTAPGPGSWIELDNLYLDDNLAVYAIPNGDFETWTTNTEHKPAMWEIDGGGQVWLTNDKHSGNYAVKLVTPAWTFARIKTPASTTIAIGPMIDTVVGYYKYIAAPGGISIFNRDSGFFQVDVYDNNNLVVKEYVDTLKPVSNYTYFSIPLTGAANATHMTIRIFTGAEGSEFYVDDVVLKHIDTTDTGTVVRNIPILFPVSIYPNPVKDVLHISTDQPGANVDIVIMDAMGAVVRKRNGIGHMPADIPVSDLAPGTYFCEIKQGSITVREKFIKQ